MYFHTTDMSLAAYLMCIGHFCVGDGWDDESFRWTFDQNDDLMRDVTEYHGGTALVDPRKHNATIGNLKRKVFG